MITLTIVTLAIVAVMVWAVYNSPHFTAQRDDQKAALAKLVKRADKQHKQILFGSEKAGTYGIFPPAVDLDEPAPPKPPSRPLDWA